VAPPTPDYIPLQGSAEKIPVISMHERGELFALAQSFHEREPEPEPLQPRNQQGGTKDTRNPFEEYNEAATPAEVCDLLTGKGWKPVYSKGGKDFYKRPGNSDAVTSGDYHHEKKVFGVFTTNGHPFEARKGYSPAAILNALYFGGDWKATAAHLRGQGYGKPINGEHLKAVNTAAAMIRANKPAARIVDALTKDGHAPNEEKAREIIQQAEQSVNDETGEFWQFTERGGVKIDFTRFYELLAGLGFARWMDSGSTKPVYLQTVGMIVREVAPGGIAAAVFDYLQKAGAPAEVENQFRKQAPALLSDYYLSVLLAGRNIQTVRDTEHTKYLPFLNGLAAMDQAGRITVIPYTDAPGYVWESHVIPRNFDADPDFMFSLNDCEFYRFIECIAGEADKPGHDPRPRTEYAVRVFGYLCDTFKNPARPWCIVLSEETADDNKGGGTGKGLFMQGVKQTAPVCFIDGKAIRADDPELFSRVEPFVTRVAFIDDARKQFKIETLNNQISDTFVIRRLYKGQTAMPYRDSPKVAVSTNYAVEVEANHAARRVRQFEFSPTFGPKYSPEQRFGHLLFDGWDQHEFNRFYNFVFYAVSQYRRHPDGLEITPPSEAATIKAARINHGREFVEWILQAKTEYAGATHTKNEVYAAFREYTGFSDKEYSKQRFYRAMDQAGAALGLPFTQTKLATGTGTRAPAYKFYEAE